jgi:glycosyltransferase involved in cell wall biosynthesis
MSADVRIAFFTDLYPPYIGGQPNRFHELATRLAARGHDVSVHCVRTHGVSAADAIEAGVHVVRSPLDERYDNPVIAATKRGVLSTTRFALTVRRVLRTEAVDIAYFNQWPYLHILAAPRRARAHSMIDWCELREGPVYGLVQRRLPRMAAANLCVNDRLAERLSAMSGAPVGYLPSGAPTDQLWSAPESERDGLLFLGRFVDTKDLPLLIAGFGELYRRGTAERLRIAGDGALASELHRAIAKLTPGARDRIDVLGTVTDDDKARLLATSRVLVLSSRREGFPVVVAEAMASGLPVATVDRPENGTAHVVSRYGIGASGPPTPAGLADAVESVMRGWAGYSARGLDGAAGLDWDRIVDRFLTEAEALVVATGT